MYWLNIDDPKLLPTTRLYPCSLWGDSEILNCYDCMRTIDNEAFCLITGFSVRKWGRLKSFVSTLFKLGNYLSYIFFLSLFFGLCKQQCNKSSQILRMKTQINFCLEGATLEKMFLHCLLKNVLFQYHRLVRILISSMDKIMNFKRHFTFHNVQIILVTTGSMVTVVCAQDREVILYVFSFSLFVCLSILQVFPQFMLFAQSLKFYLIPSYFHFPCSWFTP